MLTLEIPRWYFAIENYCSFLKMVNWILNLIKKNLSSFVVVLNVVLFESEIPLVTPFPSVDLFPLRPSLTIRLRNENIAYFMQPFVPGLWALVSNRAS